MSQQPKRNDDQSIIAVAVLFGLVIALLFLVFAGQPVPAAPPEALAAIEATAAAQTATAAPPVEPTAVVAEPTPEAVVSAPGTYTADQVAAGQRVYGGICFACHGQGGVGVAGLGKPLVNSEFVDGLSDDDLAQFIIVGRQPTDPLNTTGQLMPARGGNPSLTDEDMYNVVAYIRSLNGAPVEGVEAPAQPTGPVIVSTPTAPEDWVAPPINALDGSVVASNISNTGTLNVSALSDGGELYAWYCAACHGPAGEGVHGEAALVGMDIDFAAFASTLTTPAPLVPPAESAFVHAFRGGVPEMSDEQIAALVEFLQGLGG